MIAIADYGLGNVSAFANAYKRLNIPCCRASEASDLESASGIILPGVGAFDYAMGKFEDSRIADPIRHRVINHDTPVLGICVGMQMLASSSEEGHRQGLGWIDGVVRKFEQADLGSRTPLPHMGWNNVEPTAGHALFEGLDDHARFYFLHSYIFECSSPDSVVSTTEYRGRFASAVGDGNIYGVQFHPEKSHNSGLRLLRNFANLSMAA